MRGIRSALLCAFVVYALVLGVTYALVPPSPDLQLFDYAGWVAASGGKLYVDVAEQNWPGAMWLHTLATYLFGVHVWTFRAFDYLILLGASSVMWALLRRAGAHTAAWIVVPLYLGMYVSLDVWISGQRNIVAAHVLMLMGLLLLNRQAGGRRGWLVLMGVLMTFAVMMRPTYLLFGPMLAAADVLARERTGRTFRTIGSDVALVAGVVLGCVALLAWAAVNGGELEAWKAVAIDFNTEVYARTRTYSDVTNMLLFLMRSWHWYTAFAIAGLVWWIKQGERPVLTVVSALCATTVLSAYVERMGFGYHFGGLVPVLAMLAAYFMGAMIELARARVSVWRMGALACVIGIACVGLVKKLDRLIGPPTRYLGGELSYPEMISAISGTQFGPVVVSALRASEYAKRHSRPNDTVLVWDRHVLVNTLAERKSPTRFINMVMLELANPPFSHAEEWNRELAEALEGDHPPAVIFVPSQASLEHAKLFEAERASLALQTVRRTLASRYRKDASFGHVDAYLLSGGTASR